MRLLDRAAAFARGYPTVSLTKASSTGLRCRTKFATATPSIVERLGAPDQDVGSLTTQASASRPTMSPVRDLSKLPAVTRQWSAAESAKCHARPHHALLRPLLPSGCQQRRPARAKLEARCLLAPGRAPAAGLVASGAARRATAAALQLPADAVHPGPASPPHPVPAHGRSSCRAF